MNLYVWSKDFLTDWTSGMLCVTAPSLVEAREKVRRYLRGYESYQYHRNKVMAGISGPPDRIIAVDGPDAVAYMEGGS